MTAVHADIPLSPGAQLLYERIKAPAAQPLWILCWGGANTLAQALLKLEASFPTQDLKRLLSRIRVYTISDQDDCGPWIRHKYPEIFYIASIHAWNQYGMAAWTGISGEKYYGFDHGGPNSKVIEKDWVQKNIQSGPLGSVYPDHLFTAEGATPTFLYLVQNGLSSPEHPEFGSWGGRYAHTNTSTNGVGSNHYSDVVDRVIVGDRTYVSNHATIWRWREAFQDDFAARIKWSIEPDFSKANHHPIITINDVKGLTPVRIEVGSSSTVALDTNGTYDPAGRALSFKWWHYREPTATQWEIDAEVPVLDIKYLDDKGRRIEVNILPPKEQSSAIMSEEETGTEQRLHLILEVTNNGTPPLTTYRRVLMLVSNRRLPVGKAEIDGIRERVKSL